MVHRDGAPRPQHLRGAHAVDGHVMAREDGAIEVGAQHMLQKDLAIQELLALWRGAIYTCPHHLPTT